MRAVARTLWFSTLGVLGARLPVRLFSLGNPSLSVCPITPPFPSACLPNYARPVCTITPVSTLLVVSLGSHPPCNPLGVCRIGALEHLSRPGFPCWMTPPPPTMLSLAVTLAAVAVFACALPGPTPVEASSVLNHVSALDDGCATSGIVSASATVRISTVAIVFLSPISLTLQLDSFLARIFTLCAAFPACHFFLFLFSPPLESLQPDSLFPLRTDSVSESHVSL